MYEIIVLLVVAHVVADFALQPHCLVNLKKKFIFLLLHAAIHAVLSYLVLQVWSCWQIPIMVLFLHGFIDFIKQRLEQNAIIAFIVDQSIHILSLFGIGWIVANLWGGVFAGIGYKPIVFIAGFIATVNASGIFIGKITKQLVNKNGLKLVGLVNGGKIIGGLERTLIFLLIFIGQPAGIGFLVAAKSILRFQEAKDQKLAEYVLIGTLLSFSLAIAIASVTKWAIDL